MADEWLEGKDASPKLISLRPGGDATAKTAGKPKKGLAGLGTRKPQMKAATQEEVVQSATASAVSAGDNDVVIILSLSFDDSTHSA